MIVTNVHKDPEALTLSLSAELPVAAERAWLLWADPQQLQRWWGPPTWPATFGEHDLTPGGRASYVMTGPDGERAGGLWEVLEVDPPRRLVVRDLFADEEGVPLPDMVATLMTVTIADAADGVTMTVTSQFDSVEAMEQVVAMGAVEGMLEAMSQIEGVLAD